jgi:predicted nuclease with RNAse H fold
MFEDAEAIARGLEHDAGLSKAEALIYMGLLERGSLPLPSKGPELKRLASLGMAILSGDGKRMVPVHPRLAVTNRYRTWREQVVKEINDRRMRVDRLILELIPVYQAATEKRLANEGT